MPTKVEAPSTPGEKSHSLQGQPQPDEPCEVHKLGPMHTLYVRLPATAVVVWHCLTRSLCLQRQPMVVAPEVECARHSPGSDSGHLPDSAESKGVTWTGTWLNGPVTESR